MRGKVTRAMLHVPTLSAAKDAFLATGVEDVLEKLSLRNNAVAVDLDPWDVVTVRIESHISQMSCLALACNLRHTLANKGFDAFHAKVTGEPNG